jgi:hypothetical protein
MEKNKVLQNPEDGLYELAGFNNSNDISVSQSDPQSSTLTIL